MESRDKSGFDGWLDKALHEYGEAEPRAGLERRVLASIAAQQTTATGWSWPWAFWTVSATVTAGLVIFLTVDWHTHQKAIVNSPARLPVVTHTADRQVTTGSHQAPVHRPRRVRQQPYPLNAAAKAEPELDQFPSRRPLTEQERMLTEYVAQFPSEAKLVAKEQAEIEKEMDQLYAENDRSSSQEER